MAKDEPIMPEEAATAPVGEIPAEEKGAPAVPPPEVGGEHIPVPGDVVVPSDKINELMSEKKPARRGRPPKADRAEQVPAPEKTDAEKLHQAPKKERKPRAEKQKLTSVKKALAKEEPQPRSRNRRRSRKSLRARAKWSKLFF